MPFVSSSRRYWRQPEGVPIIDWSSTLARGLRWALPFNGQPYVVGGQAKATMGAAGSFITGARGRCFNSAGVVAAGSVPLDLTGASKITLAFWLWWPAYADDDKFVFEFTANVATAKGFTLNPNSSGAGAGKVGFTANSNTIVNPFTFFYPRPTAAVWHHFVWCVDISVATKIAKAYLDGQVWTSNGSANTSKAATGTFVSDTLYLFSRNNAAQFGDGKLQDFLIYDRWITNEEALQLYERPWSVYTPPRKRVFFQAATVLTADAGSYA